MPLLLNRADLRAFVTNPACLAALMDATEDLVVTVHDALAADASFTGFSLNGGDVLQSFVCAMPGRHATLRVFPGPGNATTARDAWVALLLDAVGGALLAVLATDDLNPLRTAVPAAVGVRHLAPADARVLAILGSGTQARWHARLYALARPKLEEIRVWSPTPEHRRRFAEEVAVELDLPVVAADHPADALADADVVTAAGATRFGGTAVEDGWVRPGALFVSLTRSAPPESSGWRLFVPTLAWPNVVAFAPMPRLPLPPPRFDPAATFELAAVITGGCPARESSDQTVLFELAGPYLWDVPILESAYRWAVDQSVGSPFSMSGVD